MRTCQGERRLCSAQKKPVMLPELAQDNSTYSSSIIVSAKDKTRYIKNVLINACVSAIHAESFGPWIRLMEVLSLIKPLAEFLLSSKRVRHYITKVYQFCSNNRSIQQLNVQPALEDVFGDFDFPFVGAPASSNPSTHSAESFTSSFGQAPDAISCVRVSRVLYSEETMRNLFHVQQEELLDRAYVPKGMMLTDLQCHLPSVVMQISKLESAWRKLPGLILASVNTDLPQVIHKDVAASSENLTDYHPSPQCISAQEQKKSQKPMTGMEVVEFLIKCCRTERTKVWYLNFVPSITYSPYDLLVVSKNKVEDKHVVISIFGVLLVQPNGQSFLRKLTEWYVEASQFYSLKKISFFKNFVAVKFFTTWKKNVRFARYLKVRSFLSSVLLSAIPAVSPGLRQISRLLSEYQHLQLLPMNNVMHSLEEFTLEVDEHLASKRLYMDRLTCLVQKVILQVFHNCRSYYEYCRDNLSHPKNDIKESMALVRRRRQKQAMNLMQALSHLLRLQQFVKLASLMVFSHSVDIGVQSVKDFTELYLSRCVDGAFVVVLEFDQSRGKVVVPELQYLNQFLSNAIDKVVCALDNAFQEFILPDEYFDVLTKARSAIIDDQSMGSDILCSTRQFHPLLLKDLSILSQQEPNICERVKTCPANKTTIKSVLQTSEVVTTCQQQIKLKLKDALNDFENQISANDWYTNAWRFVSGWSMEQLKEWKEVPRTQLEKEIVQIKLWIGELLKMPGYWSSCNGLLRVDINHSKRKLKNDLQEIFDSLVTSLLQHCMLIAEKLILKLAQLVKQLNVLATAVDIFSEYFLLVLSAQTQVHELHAEVDFVKASFDLIRHCCRELTEDEADTENKVWSSWEDFMFALQTASEHVSSQTPGMIQHMSEAIEINMMKAALLVHNGTSDRFLDADQKSKEVVLELKQTFQQFEDLHDKVVTYSKYQWVLTKETKDLSELMHLKAKITSRYEVWKYLDMTRLTLSEWKNTLFSKLCIKKVVEKVDEWNKAYKSLREVLPQEDAVLARWINLVASFSENIDVLRALSSSLLKGRHWKQMFLTLNGRYKEDHSYRLFDLLSLNLVEHRSTILSICRSATAEYALEDCLNQMIKLWKKRDFKFAKLAFEVPCKMKANSHVYTLTKVEELLYLTEDSLITLHCMLVSPHVDEVRCTAMEWNCKLQDLRELLCMWMSMQQQWLFLGNTFANNEKLIRASPSEFEQFLEAHEQIQKVVEYFMHDSKVLNFVVARKTDKEHAAFDLDGMKKILAQLSRNLFSVISRLSQSVEDVRSEFPRLYFLCDNDMYNLLSISSNPQAFVPFVTKCFPTIKNVHFQLPENGTGQSLTSRDVSLNAHLLEAVEIEGDFGERVILCDRICPKLPPSAWLRTMECFSKRTIMEQLRDCYEKYFSPGQVLHVADILKNFDSHQIHLKFTYQVISLCHQVAWFEQLRSWKHPGAQRDMLNYSCAEVGSVSSFIRSSQTWICMKENDMRTMLIAQSILLQALQHRDFIESVANDSLEADQFFGMLKLIQLRLDRLPLFSNACSSRENSQPCFNLTIDVLGMSFPYGYEYYGSGNRIFLTPLTERCLLTIATAFQKFKACCFFGNPCTGKTDTAREVTRFLGRHFEPVSCDAGGGFKAVILRAFLGAVQSGSVLCFENVDRLGISDLRLLGSYLKELSTALVQQVQIMKSTATDSSKTSFFDARNERQSIPIALQVFPSIPSVSQPSWGSLLIKLNDHQVHYNSLFGCVMTMGPEFHCWKKIPDSLRENVRAVAFPALNVARIFETYLFVSGYSKCSSLAQKLSRLFTRCQSRYPMKLMLVAITAATKQMLTEKVMEEKEDACVLKMVYSVLRPGLSLEEAADFAREIEVLCPSVAGLLCKSMHNLQLSDGLLVETVKEQLRLQNMSEHQTFVGKVLELFHAVSRGRSIILLGATATGKTACYQTLSRALCNSRLSWSALRPVTNPTSPDDDKMPLVNLRVLYPNVMSSEQMFGGLCTVSKCWQDGILPKILRHVCMLNNAAKSMTPQDSGTLCGSMQHWLVFDGFMQPSWTQPLETLLDSTGHLTLKSMESIASPDGLKLIFETSRLSKSSPSLVARSSIVLFEENHILQWNFVWHSWKVSALKKFHVTNEGLAVVESILTSVVDSSTSFLNIHAEAMFTIDSSDIVCHKQIAGPVFVGSALKILGAVLQQWASRDASCRMPTASVHSAAPVSSEFLKNAISYACANAFLGCIHPRFYSEADVHLRQAFSTCSSPVVFPSSILNCVFDGSEGKLVRLQDYESILPSANSLPSPSSYFLTKQLQSRRLLLELLVGSGANVVVTGSTGSGKSAIVKYLVSTKHYVNTVQVSSCLRGAHFLHAVREKVGLLKKADKRTDLLERNSHEQKRRLLFLEDVHLARCAQDPDVCDGYSGEPEPVQPIHDCIRQIVCEGGVFNYQTGCVQQVREMQFIMSVTPASFCPVGAGSSVHPLDARLLRHFSAVHVPCPDHDDLVVIYGHKFEALVNGSFPAISAAEFGFGNLLAQATIKLHDAVCKNFQASPQRPCYVFTYHDIARVYKGMCLYSPPDVRVNELMSMSLDVDSQSHIKLEMQPRFSTNITGTSAYETSSSHSISDLQDSYRLLVRLWSHEVNRVYGDRLCTATDYARFSTIVGDLMKSFYRSDIVLPLNASNGMSEAISPSSSPSIQEDMMVFNPEVMFMKLELRCRVESSTSVPIGVESAYKEVTKTFLGTCLERSLLRPSERGSHYKDTVFFDDLLKHVVALARCLAIPFGHALLISKMGHGRSEVAQAVAMLSGYQLYEVSSCQEDEEKLVVMKDACNAAAFCGKPVVLIIHEFSAVAEHMVAVISGGSPSELYSPTELSITCSKLLPAGSRAAPDAVNSDWIVERFFQRIRSNLHIVVCVDYAELYQLSCRHPVLILKTTSIDVYNEWEPDVYISIVRARLQTRMDVGYFEAVGLEAEEKALLSHIGRIMAEMHASVLTFTRNEAEKRQTEFFSPLKLTELVDLFCEIHKVLVRELTIKMRRMEAALEKAGVVTSHRDDMSSRISNLEFCLGERSLDAQKSEKELQQKQIQLKEAIEAVELHMDVISKLKSHLSDLALVSDQELKKLTPLYNAAMTAVALLDYHDVDEIRSYRVPPDGVLSVAAIICHMFGVEPRWEEAKLMFMRDNFFQDLQFYDKDNIPESVFELVTQFVRSPASSPDDLYIVSKAAAHLCKWIHAVHTYGLVVRALQPTKLMITEVEQSIVQAEKQVAAKKSHQYKQEMELQRLADDHAEKLRVETEISLQLQKLQQSLKHADQLLQAISVHVDEWRRSLDCLSLKLKCAVGDSLLSSAIVCYLGALPEPDQEKLLVQWQSSVSAASTAIQLSEKFSIVEILSPLFEKSDWFKHSLRNGLLDTESAVKVKTVADMGRLCWPMLVDPRQCGEHWVKAVEGVESSLVLGASDNSEKRGLVVLRADDNQLEDGLLKSMKYGFPVLVTHVEFTDRDSTLVSFLNELMPDAERGREIMVKGHDVTIHSAFRLYLSTSLSQRYLWTSLNKHFPLRKCVLISFESESIAIKEQLMHIILTVEKPDIESQYRSSQVDVQFLVEERKVIHEGIMQRILDLPGDMLETPGVLFMLESSREQLWLNEEKHKEAQAFYNKTAALVDGYRPLAEHALKLYDLLSRLRLANSFYVFCLSEYYELFTHVLRQSISTRYASSSAASRVEEIKHLWTARVYERACKSLFQEDLLLLPLLMCISELQLAGTVSDGELKFFMDVLLKPVAFGCCSATTCRSERPSWISDQAWHRFQILSKASVNFAHLIDSLESQGDLWKEYFSLKPVLLDPPYFEFKQLSYFQVALLWISYDVSQLQCICEDLVLCMLGPAFVSVPRMLPADLLSNSSAIFQVVVLPDSSSPLILDAVSLLSSYGLQVPRVTEIAMSEDCYVEVIREALLDSYERKGWLILSSCDMVKAWPAELLKTFSDVLDRSVKDKNMDSVKTTQSVVDGCSAASSVSSFRLWLIVRANSRPLPAIIMENCQEYAWDLSRNTKDDVFACLKDYTKGRGDSKTEQIVLAHHNEVVRILNQFYRLPCQISGVDVNYGLDLFEHVPLGEIQNFTESDRKKVEQFVRSIVYSPQMLAEGDLEGSGMVAQNEGSWVRKVSFQTDHLTRVIYGSVRNLVDCEVCDPERVTPIIDAVSSILLAINIYPTQDASFVRSALISEARRVEHYLKVVMYDLTLLLEVLLGKRPWNRRSELISASISKGVVPEVWSIERLGFYGVSGSLLSDFLSCLDKDVSFWSAALKRECSHAEYDLSKFGNLARFFHACFLDHVAEMKFSDHLSLSWCILLPPPDSSHHPSEKLLVRVSGLKLVHASVDEITGFIKMADQSPEVHILPTVALVLKHVTSSPSERSSPIPLYQRNCFDCPVVYVNALTDLSPDDARRNNVYLIA